MISRKNARGALWDHLFPFSSSTFDEIGDRENETTHRCGLDDKHVEILRMM
jgi:hypothetical protein